MKLRIDHYINLEHITWAAHQLLENGDKLTKKDVLAYLREQVELFGVDCVSLFGENYHQTYDDEYIQTGKAYLWAKSKFKDV